MSSDEQAIREAQSAWIEPVIAVLIVQAALVAGRGQMYRCPLTLRFFR